MPQEAHVTGWYRSSLALALFPADVTGFLHDSQVSKWAALEGLLGPKVAATVLDSLSKELVLKGTLHVLRHGFKCYGKTFRMAYFDPRDTAGLLIEFVQEL